MDGDLYYPGCKVHGTSILLQDEDDAAEAEALNPDGLALGGHRRGGRGHGVPDDDDCGSPRPPLSPSAMPPYDHSNCSAQLHKSCACVNFIAEHTKAREEATKVRTDAWEERRSCIFQYIYIMY